MSAPGGRRHSPFPAAPSRPALIAHGGGNSAARTRHSLAARATFIEVDLWVRRGQLEARHERRLPGPLPILYERWYLTPEPHPTYHLDDLLLACHDRAGVVLDLKNGVGEAPPLLRQALSRSGQGVQVLATSQNWPLLREVKVSCPQLDLYYSIDTYAQFDLFRSVLHHDFLPAGVSCRHSLLDQHVVADFHDAGLAVVAWTVDDGERARDLAAWGVDAITTNQVEETRAALAASP